MHELYSCKSPQYSGHQENIITFKDVEYYSKTGAFNDDYKDLLKLFNGSTYQHHKHTHGGHVTYISGTNYGELRNNNYMLRLLLNFQDIDLLKQNLQGQTALHCMCIAGDYDDLQTVVTKKKIDANVQDNEGCTLLHIACRANSIKTVQIVLSIDGIDLSIKNKKGHTPITLAYDSAIVKLLIEHGADPQPLYNMHKKFFQKILYYTIVLDNVT